MRDREFQAKILGIERQIKVPWADGRSGFTALFEHLAISLLQEMSIAAVARIIRLTWDEIDGIMQRAISRSLALRIVTDLDAREVIWVGSGRKRETLDAFWKTLSPEQLAGIKGVAIDMWPAYIESTLAFLPDAEEKIVFDKFHVMKYLTHAVDLERRAAGRNDSTLKKTRHQWLRRPGNMSHSERGSSIRRAASATKRGSSAPSSFTVVL
jgi:transposase